MVVRVDMVGGGGEIGVEVGWLVGWLEGRWGSGCGLRFLGRGRSCIRKGVVT